MITYTCFVFSLSTYLTVCIVGIFILFFLSSADFISKLTFRKKFFQVYSQSVKQFGSRSTEIEFAGM